MLWLWLLEVEMELKMNVERGWGDKGNICINIVKSLDTIYNIYYKSIKIYIILLELESMVLVIILVVF